MPPGIPRDSKLEPVSPTFPPTFRPHVGMGPSSVSAVYVGLVLGTIPCNLQHWGWNVRICGSFRQSFQTFSAQNFTIASSCSQVSFSTMDRYFVLLGLCPLSLAHISVRRGPGKPIHRKGQNAKFVRFARLCEFQCCPLETQARFTQNVCSRMVPGQSSWTDLSLVWFAGATPDI